MFAVLYLLGVFFFIMPTVRLPVGGISPSDLFIFGALGWLLFENFTGRQSRRQFPLHILWLPAMLIIIAGFLASLNAISPFSSLVVAFKIWFVLSIWVTMTMVMARRGYLMHILIVMVAAGVCTSLVAAGDYFTGWDLGSRISGEWQHYWNREPGTYGHPNSLGYFLAVCLPVCVALIAHESQTRRRRVPRGLGIVCCGIMAFGLFLSGSVASWIGTVLAFTMLGACFLLRGGARTRRRIGIAVVVLGILGLVLLALEPLRNQVLFLLQFNLGRVTSLTGPDRFQLLDQAFRALDANPILGFGLDQTGTGGLPAQFMETSDAIHNTLISGWLNGGLLTFIAMLIAYGMALLTVLRAINYGITQRDWIVLGLGAASFSWFVFDQTQPQLTLRFTWLTIGLLFGMGFGMSWSKVSSLTDATHERTLLTRVESSQSGAGK